MDIEQVKQQIEAATGDNQKKLPPVEQWNPNYCGELNLVIKANGQWWLDGTPLTRRPLQRLFSTIIKREGDSYFLVTPVEKLGIKVEWQPFVIIDFQWLHNEAGHRQLLLQDNCDNQVLLTRSEQWRLDTYQDIQLPVVNIRRNLWASFERACYYRLVEQAEIINTNDQCQATITSNQIVFSIGTI